MTWVLGANVRFGSVLMAGDVRITMPDRGELDCLQKVHALGSSIIGGFAGSVMIGLDVLEFLKAQFATAPPGTGWELGAITATWLPRVIRDRFRRHKPEHRQLGAAFLIGGVSPGRFVQTIFPETKLFAFRSANDFRPEEIPAGGVGSIGNGQPLEDTVREVLSSQEFHLIWNSGPRMHSFILAERLRERLIAQPMPGVAPRFAMAWAVRGEQGVEPWTTRGDEPGLGSDQSVVLARNFAELDLLVGSAAAEAVGLASIRPLRFP